MYISIKRHSWFFQSWWCLLYFGHVQTRTIGKCWRQKTPFCLKLSAHAQWHQKPPFCLKLSTHAQESVLSWSISMSRILDWVSHSAIAYAYGSKMWRASSLIISRNVRKHRACIKQRNLQWRCGGKQRFILVFWNVIKYVNYNLQMW